MLTQYKAHSLIRHLQGGWGFLHKELGEFVEILPASQRVHEAWYRGTADALYQNIDILRTYKPSYVLVLAGDHVYKMDYGPMLAFPLRAQGRPHDRLHRGPLERGERLRDHVGR